MRRLTVFFSCATVFIQCIISVASTSDCSRSLPSYESEITGGQFSTGGVQLLIPSWNFSCQGQGTIKRWFAHVTGNTSIADLLEFQIFRSDFNSEDLYHLVYHNTLNENTVDGSMLTKVVNGLGNDPFLPVRNGYIVGVYIPPNTDFNINLLYDTDGDTDVYYWENLDSRTCDFSLCSGKIMRNINLFLGWDFMDSSLISIENVVEVKKSEDTNYCQWSNLRCNNIVPSNSTLSFFLSTTLLSSSTPSTSTPSFLRSTTLLSSSTPTDISTISSLSFFPDQSEDGPVDVQFSFQLFLIITTVLIVLSVIIIICLVLFFLFLFKRHHKNALNSSKEGQQPVYHKAISSDVKIHENPSYHAVAKHDTIQGERIYCKPGPDDHHQYYEGIEESSCNDYMQIRVQDHYVSGNKLFDPSDV